MIDLVERCGRQRLARSVEIMRLALELCEQRLPVERRAEALKEVVEDVCAALFVRLGLQQILGQQDLVDRRGDLGDHDAVIVVDIILRRIREPGVHGVAQLVRQRERVVECSGIVHQHIRMHAEHTARERAGLLAVVLIYIDPALCKRAVKQLLVFLAQRQRCLLDQLLRVLKRDGIVDVLHDGDIQIKHVDFVELERAAAQLQIFAHGGQALVHGLDQAVIDGHGNVAAVQRRLADWRNRCRI